jgi:multiple sugar transport system permease protein
MIIKPFSQQSYKAYLFLCPALIIMIFGLFYPILYSVYASFFDWRLGTSLSDAQFTLFDNYLWLLNDDDVLKAFGITLKFTIIVVIIEVFLGVLFALLLDRTIRGLSVFRTIFIMPMMIAPIIVGLIWQYMYDAQFGVFNKILSYLGLSPVGWLSSPDWALFSVILADIWQWTPFIFILTVASLQSLPKSIIEVATIDGASQWQIIWYIKLPIIMPVIIITAILRFIDSFKVFEVIYIMTSGGPAQATEVISMTIYNQAFIDFELGRAAALSNLFLAFMIIISLVFLCVVKLKNQKQDQKQDMMI